MNEVGYEQAMVWRRLYLATLLLRTKEAWLEVSYSDGRKEIRRWDASLMRPSSSVMGNLRSRPEFRAGTWQNNGVAGFAQKIEF